MSGFFDSLKSWGASTVATTDSKLFYSPLERIRLDLQQNMPSDVKVGVRAMNEISRMSQDVQLDLLDLPQNKREALYRTMEEVYTKGGPLPENFAERMVSNTMQMTLHEKATVDPPYEIGEIDESVGIEMQPLLAYDTDTEEDQDEEEKQDVPEDKIAEASPQEIAEFEELMQQTVELGQTASTNGIQPFRQEDIAVGPNGEFWLTRQGLRNWAAGSAKGFATSNLFIGPILKVIDVATGSQGFSSYINTGLNLVTMLTSGDPTGLIFQGAMEIWKAVAESQQKHKENLRAGADRGKKMGYVRDGDKWVPAVFNTHYQDEGLWAKGGTVTAQFGDTILYTAGTATYGSDASVQPVVVNKDGSAIGHRSFRLSNEEYQNTSKDHFGDMYGTDGYVNAGAGDALSPGSLEYVQRRDMLRNWYFDDGDLQTHDATLPENASAYERQLDDWRKALQLAAGGGTKSDVLRGQMTEWDASAALRDQVQSSFRSARGPSFGAAVPTGGMHLNDLRGLSSTEYTDKLVSDGNYKRYDMPENAWLLDTMFKEQVRALQLAQRNAASEAGFEDRYGYDPYREYHKTDSGPAFFKASSYTLDPNQMAPDQSFEYQPIWASLYLDTSKSLDTADDAAELQQQMDTINGYSDRSDAQKTYLRQKQITRYWIQQIESRGGSQAFLDSMFGKSTDVQSGKNRVNNAAYDFERIANDSKFEDDPWQNTFVRSRYEGMNGTPGWTMPWQNAGEGALPDSEYTGDLPVYYTDNLERMHDESVEHTQQWIEQHGKYNPNLLLDGELQHIGRVGILESAGTAVTEDDGDDAPEVEQEHAPERLTNTTGFDRAGDGVGDETLQMLRTLGIDPSTIAKKHDPPKAPPAAPAKPADGPPLAPAPGVTFNEAHNTTHHYSYMPAPRATHYQPLPSDVQHVDMGFVHHMERLSSAGAVKTI